MDEQTIIVEGRLGKLPSKRPCRECPLRQDSVPGSLGGYAPYRYLTILHGPVDIACHMSKGFHERDHAAQRSCTGVAMYRANTGVIASGHAHEATQVVGREAGDACEEIAFGSPEAFYQHHNTPEGEACGWIVRPRETPAREEPEGGVDHG